MKDPITLKILIVDDNPGNILALRHLLAGEDRIIYTACSGNEALKLALTNPPDLLLLDVHMPDIDGFEVARTVRQNKRTQDIPILFATAERKEHHSMLKGFEEGAIDYLFKPLDPEVTKAKVAILLKMQLQKKELEQADKQIKELNQQLQKNVASLETANKELESFSYSVSHDLRTPLRAIDGYAEILAEDYKDKLDAEGKRLITNIITNAKKMGLMVDKLLEFSKLGKKAIQKHDVDMDRIVNDSIHEATRSSEHKPAFTKTTLPGTKADPILLSHVWTNLITNAIKYSSKKQQPKIEIGSYSEQEKTIYYIKDNGTGFDMTYADKLFGVFQRLHKEEDFQGTGAGLAIVKRIINKHGGEVWAEGKPGEGAAFYFTLPRTG
jgi:signal transduction histidine kinase